ncbi:hypothetical protein ACN08N_18530 [Photobacterium leiognathi subsp. mandapamensis]|uniref:hypothetical protein n=1 Tax=Photobacterium leiognathi TaxID=553611 RepID=UPI003AF3A717
MFEFVWLWAWALLPLAWLVYRFSKPVEAVEFLGFSQISPDILITFPYILA